MAKSMEGRTALVTGGGSGIGRATALEFADQGASVVFADQDGESARVTSDKIGGLGGMAVHIKADVSINSEIEAMVEISDLQASKSTCRCHLKETLVPHG